MDTVLGVSMAPTTVRMVLVEGQNADGVTVDEDNFAVADGGDPATFSAPDQVVAAILGTREGASEAGYDLLSTGVTWSDQCEAAELRDALAARKVENVMLVSAFLAAAALAQSMGSATGYARAALLYVEPDSATLAVVDTTDGSITDVKRAQLPDDDDQAVAALVSLVSAAEGLDEQPDGLHGAADLRAFRGSQGLVAAVEFAEWTSANHLRHSKYIALREDKDPNDVVREVLAAEV